jgi:hypothetical protein
MLATLPRRGLEPRLARRRTEIASAGCDSTAMTMSLVEGRLADHAQQPVAGLDERGEDLERLERPGQPPAVALADGLSAGP